MEKISVSKFKATCLELFERVGKTGESYIITKRGVAIARVIPAPEEKVDKKNYFGCMSGTSKETGDIMEPLPESDWEVFG
ncbi:MAG: type II toxin-antitoxin system Phd/YefM family antitoxin [Thermodesulfobacteriota bacterium]